MTNDGGMIMRMQIRVVLRQFLWGRVVSGERMEGKKQREEANRRARWKNKGMEILG